MDTCHLVLQLRRKLNESHELFARRIGCGLQTTTRWEKGRRPPPVCALARLSQVAEDAGHGALAQAFDLAIQNILTAARKTYVVYDTGKT